MSAPNKPGNYKERKKARYPQADVHGNNADTDSRYKAGKTYAYANLRQHSR